MMADWKQDNESAIEDEIGAINISSIEAILARLT
jgi:hypothetical protein